MNEEIARHYNNPRQSATRHTGAEMNPMEQITDRLSQDQIDSIAEVIWWLKGHMATMLMTEAEFDIQPSHIRALTDAWLLALNLNASDDLSPN